MILQYRVTLANPALSAWPTTKQFNENFLFTYRLHPGTAISVGYNSDFQNIDPGLPGPERPFVAQNEPDERRTFFVKVSYVLRLRGKNAFWRTRDKY